ncbi:TerD family protein [Paenibacillus kribbensis]|jgi:tellurium resistance protein TerD|uniref:TerD family protein n=1 Tax=Paenibacillus TaxID=44249 RepID=UPI00024EF6D1|nr:MULTISPECIES: TerD family protein [Paenibacillus]EHS59112.1 tellurium resistance protein, terd family [Paenibacillus sp. Aloe-11]MEC0232891.1 TerD family protein [Paenibacillus kribbensis]
MAINLSKGQKIDLTKTNPGLSKITVGLGWDTNKYDGGKDFDLDVSVFLANADGKVETEKNFVFFNNPQNENGSVVHTGDNRTGDGDGDDEQIKVDLSSVPANVEKIAFTITIYEAQERNQNFGQVSRAYARIVNEANNEELVRFDLGEDFSIETGVVVGELYRHSGEWKFNAIGSGYQDGLAGLTRDYGLA